jgi:hypothetical protein
MVLFTIDMLNSAQLVVSQCSSGQYFTFENYLSPTLSQTFQTTHLASLDVMTGMNITSFLPAQALQWT